MNRADRLQQGVVIVTILCAAVLDLVISSDLSSTRPAFVAGAMIAGTCTVGLLWDRAAQRRPLLVATSVSFAVAALLFGFHFRVEPTVWDGDARVFYRMAEEWPWRPDGWWRYRLLVPGAVHALPFSTNNGYALISFLSVGATGPALSLLQRDLGHGIARRHLGTALYLASFAALYNSYNYVMPDPAALLVVVLGARAIVRGRDWELLVWLVVGTVTKEVALFLVPARVIWGAQPVGLMRSLMRTALVGAPAALLFLALRALPGEAEQLGEFVGGNAWLFPWKHQPDNVARLYSPFAAGWALVALALWRPARWEVCGVAFAIPCLLSLLVTDAGRMLVYLTPFAIPAIVRVATPLGVLHRRGIIAIVLVALSMKLWEPFFPLWQIPVEIRRPIALLLAPVVVWLVWPLETDPYHDLAPSKTAANSPARDA